MSAENSGPEVSDPPRRVGATRVALPVPEPIPRHGGARSMQNPSSCQAQKQMRDRAFKESPLVEAGRRSPTGADSRRWRGHLAEHCSARARLARQCGPYSSIVALS